MGPHVPSAPAPFLLAEHAWHKLVQDVLQQTPSTQLPDWQSVAFVQTAPLPKRPMHTPPLQEKPFAQSALVMHIELQTPLVQLYGEQFIGAPLFVHVPAPSHVLGCTDEPAQDAPQFVPLA